MSAQTLETPTMENTDIDTMHDETCISVSDITKGLSGQSPLEDMPTFTEARQAFNRASVNDSIIRTRILEKMLTMVSNLEDAQELYDLTPDDSMIEKLALARLNFYAARNVARACTFTEAEAALDRAPEDSEAEVLGVRRLISLISTAEEAKIAWEKPTVTEDALSQLVLKVATLFPKETSNS